MLIGSWIQAYIFVMRCVYTPLLIIGTGKKKTKTRRKNNDSLDNDRHEKGINTNEKE